MFLFGERPGELEKIFLEKEYSFSLHQLGSVMLLWSPVSSLVINEKKNMVERTWFRVTATDYPDRRD